MTAGTIGHWLKSDISTSQVALYWSDYTPEAMTDYNGFGAAQAALEIHTGALGELEFGLYQDGRAEQPTKQEVVCG